MKGQMFNLLESFIVNRYGREPYEEIVNEVAPMLQTKSPFVGPGTYPDSDFISILEKAIHKVKIQPERIVFQFGVYCFPFLAARIPELMKTFTDFKSFLESIDSVIHVEVMKLMPGAEPPRFQCVESNDGKLVMRYESKRRMYALVEGLIQGAAAYFKQEVSVQREVQDNGDAQFVITFVR